jgi:hypothetical protein
VEYGSSDFPQNLRRLRPINTPDDLQSAAFDAMMLVRAGEVERAQAVDDLYDNPQSRTGRRYRCAVFGGGVIPARIARPHALVRELELIVPTQS